MKEEIFLNKKKMLFNENLGIREIFLKKIGSTWLYDSFYLFLIVPMGMFGALLNILSFFIFLKKDLRGINFYKYFQLYALTSAVLSLILSMSFMQSPRFFFEISISQSARIFKCLIEGSYVLPLFLFFSNALNILLNIERASKFSDKLKSFKKISPYLACLCLFIVCALINLPMFFLIDTASDEYINEALSSLEKAIQFKGICIRNENSLSLFGTIATLFSFVVKDLITFILDIASNIGAIICFKK